MPKNTKNPNRKSKPKMKKDRKQDKRIKNLEFVANGVEIKQHAVQQNALNFGAGGVVINHCNVAQGDSSVDRVGDSIKMIQLNINLAVRNTSNVNDVYVRFITFKTDLIATQVMGGILTDVDFLTFPNATANLAYTTLGNLNGLQYKHKNPLLNIPGAIQILKDSGPIHLDPFVTAGTKFWNLYKYRSKMGRKVQFTTAAGPDTSKGCVYTFCFSNDPTMTIQGYSSLLFIDP